MGLKFYLLAALVISLIATIGAEVLARMTIAGERFSSAFSETVRWSSEQLVATIVFTAPFLLIAIICKAVEKRARLRSALAIFAFSMITLGYCYTQGYFASQQALLDNRWTASALSVGLLPLLVGGPVVFTAIGAGAIAAKFDRPKST